MTVSTTNRKAGPFVGDGATTVFPFTFRVFSAEDILAVLSDVATGQDTDLALTGDYTVTVNPDQDNAPGGSLVMLTAPAVGKTLTFTTDIPLLQQVVTTNNGGFFPAIFNGVFDRLTVMIQQVQERISRTFSVSLSSSGVSLSIPVVPNAVLTWSADGTRLQALPLPDLSLSLALPSMAGQAGKFLSNDGFVAAWEDSPGLVSEVAGLTGNISKAELQDAIDFDYAGISAILGFAPTAPLADEAIIGLKLTNAVGFTTTRITMGVGQARDSTNSADLVLTTPITKRLDAVWAAGDNNGGRDAATALAAGQTWHMYIIQDPVNGLHDAIFSQSPTAPILPANYTLHRFVHSILLEAASTNIRQFIQDGNEISLVIRTADFTNTVNGGTFLRVVGVPNGRRVKAQLYYQSLSDRLAATTPSTAYMSGIYDPAKGVPPAFGVPTQQAQVRVPNPNTDAGRYVTVQPWVWTDTTQHVYTASGDPNDFIAMGVLGWMDPRRLH